MTQSNKKVIEEWKAVIEPTERCKKCGIEIDDTDICTDMCNWCAMEDGTLDPRDWEVDHE